MAWLLAGPTASEAAEIILLLLVVPFLLSLSSLCASLLSYQCASRLFCARQAGFCDSLRTRIPWSRADCDCCATATREERFRQLSTIPDLGSVYITTLLVCTRLQQYERGLPSRTPFRHEVTSTRKSRFARGMHPLSCGMQANAGHPIEGTLKDTTTIPLHIRTRSGPNHPSLYHARYIVARTETNENATC
ncbi:hypothetical protein BU25DRAFT_123746 [Macroventuria anomochaeta]|uniref:Uncharacterized protein n=1 Tax=Macroventuria anomochaeta TaxID=301207 RepID=A0ACB6RTW3_9PLEO|nr:uncharacterized protein BU25DRAFT_123746 [Macroventuria anomochaeta]KAF2625157.1 hypothetical protein BU25DRAFT_123746 [Macroventuria anomochaeta]